MRFRLATLPLLGIALLMGCRTHDAIPTDETSAARFSPAVRGHSLEFYAKDIPVYIDGVRAEFKELRRLQPGDVDTAFVVRGSQAVEKYGEWARGKEIFEFILTPEARKRLRQPS